MFRDERGPKRDGLVKRKFFLLWMGRYRLESPIQWCQHAKKEKPILQRSCILKFGFFSFAYILVISHRLWLIRGLVVMIV